MRTIIKSIIFILLFSITRSYSQLYDPIKVPQNNPNNINDIKNYFNDLHVTTNDIKYHVPVSSFEGGDDGWGDPIHSTAYYRDTSTRYEGTYSMKVYATNNNSALSIDINPYGWDLDENPEISFAYRIPNDTPVGVFINIENIGWICIGGTSTHDHGTYPYINIFSLMDINSWRTIRKNIKDAIRTYYPSADKVIEFEWYTENNASATDKFWFDAFKIHDMWRVGSYESYAEMFPDVLPGRYYATGKSLIRSTALRVIAYLQACENSANDEYYDEYIENAWDGRLYLLQEQNYDGSYTWEYFYNGSSGNPYLKAYDTAFAGIALLEAYEKTGYFLYALYAYYAACWQYENPQWDGNKSNVNYYGLQAWQLIKAYEQLTDYPMRENFRSRAIALCDSIVYWAGSPYGPNDGSWYHAVAQGNYDQYMHYHALTLRGLIETHNVVDFSTSDPKYQMILDAINFMINQQYNGSITDRKGLLLYTKNNPYNSVTHTGLKELCMAVEYGLDPYYELKPLINKMIERNLNSTWVKEDDPWHRHTSIENLGEYFRYSSLPGLPKNNYQEGDGFIESTVLPSEFKMMNNYPNPFNSTTSISYTIPKKNPIKIEIYNTLGKKIRTLLNEIREPGLYKVNWDGTDDYGMIVPSGIYVCKMYCEENVHSVKMMLLK